MRHRLHEHPGQPGQHRDGVSSVVPARDRLGSAHRRQGPPERTRKCARSLKTRLRKVFSEFAARPPRRVFTGAGTSSPGPYSFPRAGTFQSLPSTKWSEYGRNLFAILTSFDRPPHRTVRARRELVPERTSFVKLPAFPTYWKTSRHSARVQASKLPGRAISGRNPSPPRHIAESCAGIASPLRTINRARAGDVFAMPLISKDALATRLPAGMLSDIGQTTENGSPRGPPAPHRDVQFHHRLGAVRPYPATSDLRGNVATIGQTGESPVVWTSSRPPEFTRPPFVGEHPCRARFTIATTRRSSRSPSVISDRWTQGA